MGETVHVEDKAPAPQKPPLSVGRIAGEVLAGTGVGFVGGLLGGLGYLMLPYDKGCFNGISALAGAIFLVFPAVYGLTCPVGVYLAGTVGRQTGSLLLTLGCGFAGVLVVMGMRGLTHSFYWSYRFPSVPGWAFVPLVLLAPPLMAMLGFDWTRRYKKSVLQRRSSRT